MMKEDQELTAQEWAERTYGSVTLGDQRRVERAVRVAQALAEQPSATLPEQMSDPAATKAIYRLLESPAVTYERLMRPHLLQTKEQIASRPRVLLIQDLSEIDYYPQRKTKGLGPVGQGNHDGYLLQTVLAVDPQSQQVLGVAGQQPFLRQPVPAGETSQQREQRKEKETRMWPELVKRIGPAPQGCQMIHVGDRAADFFPFWRACREQGAEFLVRVKHDRRCDLLVEQGERPVPPSARRYGSQRPATAMQARHLKEVVRGWESMGSQTIWLDGNQKRAGRFAHLLISWGQLRIWPPDRLPGPKDPPMVVTVIRTWEPNPPQGVEALEWLLLSSLEVHSEEEAWERVSWYRLRWTIEDYYQCLKTGCRLEEQQMKSFEGLRTLLGFLAPLAVRVLHLRLVARQEPERAASEVLPTEMVQVVAHLVQVAPQELTVQACCRKMAQLGGYLGRKGDGEPGWKTLWRGWLYVQTLVEGIQLANELHLHNTIPKRRETCG